MQKWLTLFLVLSLAVPCVWPQASTSTASGTLRDQSGAVIPNADMVLTNTATNVTSNSKTNEVGFYFFPGLIPGPYRLTAVVPGMEKYEATFTVQVAQSVVIDPVMKPGIATATVQVTDVTPMVTVDNAILRGVVEYKRIEQLPMNGRQLNTLSALLPGSEGSGGSSGFRNFGAPAQAQEWIVDGAVVTDRRWNMALFSQSPGVGAVQEFSVDANAVSAKHSRPSNVIVSTRSGTNALHGTAYETHRNNAMGLARSRTDYYTKPPKLNRAEFGVNSGGPVFIPKLYDGRNRTFWFVNYEGRKQLQATTVSYNVPTAAMRTGDFSGLIDSQGRLLTLYDPWTTDSKTWARQPFSYGGKANVIDPNRISPTAKYLFSITPLPTNGVNPLIDYNWWGLTTQQQDYWSLSTRADHRFSDRDQFYVRLNYLQSPNHQMTNLPALNQVAGWKTVVDGERSIANSWVHTFSPSFFNEFLASGRYRIGGGYTGTSTTVGTDWFGKLGLPNPFAIKDWPQFPSSGTGLGNYGLVGPGMDRANETFYTVDDNLTRIKGRHEFQFGGHYRYDLMNIHPNDSGQTQYTFATMATSLYDSKVSTPQNPSATPYTGSNLANMFLGVASYQNSLVRSWYYLRGGEYALYFQDNYKVTQRLTMNLGLRWEYWRAYKDKNNVLVGFDKPNHAMVLGTDLDTMYKLGASVPSVVSTYQSLGLKFESWKDAGLPQNLVNPRNKNFGPRIGFAYRALDGRMSFVIRGGYSLAYFNMDQNSFVSNFNNTTPLSATFNYLPLDTAQSPDGLPNYGLRSIPSYVMGVNSQSVIDLNQPRGITRGTAQASYFAPDLPDSRVHAWNLTLEKEVMPSTVARVRYVGNHSSNLSQWYSYNQPTPDYIWYATSGQPKPTGAYANVALRPYDQQVLGTVQAYQNTGFANTQAMDFELERRYDKGYAFQLSYVMTNTLATSTFGSVPEVNQFMPGTVPADYGQRNRFLNYQRDTGIPKHRVQWNWLADLPFGKGKLVGGNSGALLDKLIGGWQLAGIGTLRSTYFALPTGNWNFTGEPVRQYGYQYPIEDCRGGTCIPGYLWWNGYIPANQINSVDANGKPNGYMGVPADYKPAVTPLIPWPAVPNPKDPNYAYYGTNNVWIPLKNGNTQIVGYNPGLNPWRNQYVPSVRQWNLDASLFKNIRIHERVDIRFAADFFNVLNHPGNPNTVGGDGFLNCRASGAATPRVLQLNLRLTW